MKKERSKTKMKKEMSKIKMKKKGVKTKVKKKLLLIIGVLTLILSFLLVVPKPKAAGDIDYSANHIGYIDSFGINSDGDIVGAYVYITDSSQSDIMYDVGYYFSIQYFQPDITVYGYDLIGKPLIWNRLDDRGAYQKGAWWLLVDYQQMLQDILDAYNEGYNDGTIDAFDSGYTLGYDNGLADGYSEGWEDGWEDGWEVGLEDGYNEGFEDAYSEIITNDEYTLGYNNGFKDGEKSKIVKNNEAFYGGIEKWLVPAIIVVIVLGGIMSISALKRREQ